MSRILVIDDNQPFADALVEFLSSEGHDVQVAYAGDKAETILSRDSFDLLVTDILMPVRDGIELIMSARKRNKDTKIIAISGGSGRLPAGLALTSAAALGADEILYKPFSLKELEAAVTRLLAAQAADIDQRVAGL